MSTRRSLLLTPLAALIAAVGLIGPSGTAARAARPRLTPVVLFPAFHLTRLRVAVRNQTVDRACPRSGSFEDVFQNPHPGGRFSQVCRDKLMTLRYSANPKLPMRRRFSDQPGVTVSVIDYGKTDSAPYYRPMYRALERAGYTANVDIRVAGYDARLTPDQGGFLHRAISLIEQTYRSNGDQPVELVGHSNGPLYAQYLLTHTSRAWRHKYIHGFTPIAGNFPGQGSLYSIVFTGLNIEDFSYPKTRANAVSSARMYLTSPATYMSAADPAVFGRREVVLRNSSTGVRYTPADFRRLFTDAHLPVARQIAGYYIGFVKFRTPRNFPDVDVTAEKGSGIATVVGAVLPSFKVGQLVKPSALLQRNGDINQEDITNNAVRVWKAMPCFRFTLTDNRRVNHFALPVNRTVLARLIANLQRPRSRCGLHGLFQRPAARTPPRLSPFHSHIQSLPAALKAALNRTLWHRGCPTPLSQLRLLTVSYIGFDRRAHRGELVVNADVARPLGYVFGRLYRLGFRIREMQPVDDSGDDTAAFECRDAVASPCPGSAPTHSWSEHAYGEAVDINPIENPYTGCGRTRVKASIPFLNRSPHRPGMVAPAVVGAFASIGWGWGGSWSGTKDYMHFSANGH